MHRITLRHVLAAAAILLFAAATAAAGIHLFSEQPAPARPEEPPVRGPTPLTADYIFTGGQVIDGYSQKIYEADVAVRNGRIIFIGETPPDAAGQTIDCSGLVVAPGFINSHSHTYEVIERYPEAVSALKQGITTEVGGVDGRSPWPLDEHFEQVENMGVGVNYALLAGHGTIRGRVVGMADRPASDGELQLMGDLMHQAMRQGALGLSTGLEYVPGTYAPTDELVQLSRAAAEHQGVYVTHMRNEGAHIIAALQEALTIGQQAGISVGISHFKVVGRDNWHLHEEAMRLLTEGREQLRTQGVTLWYDVYPYLSPDYAADVPLRQAYDNHPPEAITPKVPRLQPEYPPQDRTPAEADPIRTELTLAQLAEEAGVSPQQKVQGILAKDPKARARVIMMAEDNLKEAISGPYAVIANDASARPQMADEQAARGRHPRGWGTFPRILSRFTGADGLSLEEAVAKMTREPARYLQLAERGALREGYWADITVFDPDEIGDAASYTHPQSEPAGIEYVMVSGELAVKEGELKDDVRAGRIILGPAAEKKPLRTSDGQGRR